MQTQQSSEGTELVGTASTITEAIIPESSEIASRFAEISIQSCLFLCSSLMLLHSLPTRSAEWYASRDYILSEIGKAGGGAV